MRLNHRGTENTEKRNAKRDQNRGGRGRIESLTLLLCLFLLCASVSLWLVLVLHFFSHAVLRDGRWSGFDAGVLPSCSSARASRKPNSPRRDWTGSPPSA